MQSSLLSYFSSPTPKSSTTLRKQVKNKRLTSHDGDDPSLVPGLTIIQDFITPTQETALLTFLDAQEWRTDLARRTMHFGGTYCLMPPKDAPKDVKPAILTAPPIPEDFDDLLELFYKHDIYEREQRPEYCIVNEYLAPHGISAHVENFSFGEPVCSLTLHDGDYMRFHELSAPHDGSVRSGKSKHAQRTGRKVDVWLPARSLAVLRGDARSRWQHEVVKRKGRVPSNEGEWKRTSLTFRVKR